MLQPIDQDASQVMSKIDENRQKREEIARRLAEQQLVTPHNPMFLQNNFILDPNASDNNEKVVSDLSHILASTKYQTEATQSHAQPSAPRRYCGLEKKLMQQF